MLDSPVDDPLSYRVRRRVLQVTEQCPLVWSAKTVTGYGERYLGLGRILLAARLLDTNEA